jgi:hypothetical protein
MKNEEAFNYTSNRLIFLDNLPKRCLTTTLYLEAIESYSLLKSIELYNLVRLRYNEVLNHAMICDTCMQVVLEKIINRDDDLKSDK